MKLGTRFSAKYHGTTLRFEAVELVDEQHGYVAKALEGEVYSVIVVTSALSDIVEDAG